MTLPVVASFWTGGALSLIERTVMQSYLDRGHTFILFTEGMVEGVPDGVETCAASDIWQDPSIDLTQADRHTTATYSDLFRLHLLSQTEMIWVDCDAYCLRPFTFDSDQLFGMGGNGRVCTGVLRLAAQDDVLHRMLEFAQSRNPIQPWRNPNFRAKRVQRRDAGQSWTVYDLPWGCAGPKLLTYLLEQENRLSEAQPQKVFYPLFGRDLRKLWLPDIPLTEIEPHGCHSVHIFGASRATLLNRYDGIPPAGSYLERIALRHGTLPRRYRRKRAAT